VKSDAEIREDVTGELHWDPQVPDPLVEMSDHTAELHGHVHSLSEAAAATAAAAAAPGVGRVESHLVVSP
jgi:osmotically-inducible protein OsmY